MGIHSGPVQHIGDIDGRGNIAGAGINITQRVMDCGDAHLAAAEYDREVHRDLPSAHEHLASAVRLLPNDADSWLALAICESDFSRWSDAMNHLQKAAELAPNNDSVTLARFALLRDQRRLPEALDVLNQRIAAHLNP